MHYHLDTDVFDKKVQHCTRESLLQIIYFQFLVGMSITSSENISYMSIKTKTKIIYPYFYRKTPWLNYHETVFLQNKQDNTAPVFLSTLSLVPVNLLKRFCPVDTTASILSSSMVIHALFHPLGFAIQCCREHDFLPNIWCEKFDPIVMKSVNRLD